MPNKPSLKEVYCAVEGCAPDRFARRIIARSVPFHWRPLTWIILRFRPSVLAVELAFLEHLGTATDLDEASARMREYRGDLARARAEHRAINWGWRLRTGRVLELARSAWREFAAAKQPDGP